MKLQFFIFLAVALGCLVQAQAPAPAPAPAPVQSDFQQDQFTGRWYSIAVVSNARWFQEKKSAMKMSTTVVAPTADGNLEVTSTYPRLDQCEMRKSLFVQTEQAGHFSYTSPRSGSIHAIQVIGINHNEYALLLAKTSKGAETFTMVTLYGRRKHLRPELQEKFTQVALAEGLTQEDILILPQTDQCMAESV